MATTYQVIGTRPIRHDGIDKVTGRAQYGADFQAAGLLHGRVLRSPHAHAKIVKIDVSKALALPGVEAIVTSADFHDPGNRMANLGEGAIKLRDLSSNCMARDKVLYKGQAIAAVAAINGHIAEEACKLIAIQYEVLPSVTEVTKAMAPDAPILHDDLVTESMAAPKEEARSGDRASTGPVEARSPDRASTKTNVAKHLQYKLGDPDKGFAEATVVVERTFNTATVHQGYIEPHNASALWNSDGTVTIWCSTQGSFSVRAQVAELLQLPVAKIKVVPMEIGGGFGGKIRVYLEPVAALLSKKTGKPVKVLMDRASVFEATGPTPGSHIRVKVGADKNGKITAAEAYLAYEAGAFAGSPIWAGCVCILSCYDIPNLLVNGYDVVLNKPATSAYRAPGATNAAMAMETVVDEICEKLKIDPLDFRIKNAAKEGTRRADGPAFPRVGNVETLETAKKHPHYTAPLTPATNPAFKRGRGVASGFWFNIGLKSCVSASVNGDGSVSLVEGSTDIGGTRTSIAMQLAETLGIRAEDIKPSVGDTDTAGYTDVTGGSRVTYATGWAAYEAGKDIQRQMIEKVAALWTPDWTGPFRAPFCQPQAGEFDMTFSTTWGTWPTDNAFLTGTGTFSGTLQGLPLAAQVSAAGAPEVGAAAGVDPNVPSGLQSVLIPPVHLTDGRYVAPIVVIQTLSIAPGVLPIDDVTVQVFLLDFSTDPATNLGRAYDGTLTLTSASLVAGSVFEGSLHADLVQLGF